MQNIKLTIYGDFWDSQIYSRNLYIFGASGDLYTIDWDKFINDYFSKKPTLQTIAHVAFIESDLFYTHSSQILFKDPTIANYLKQKFIAVSQLNIELILNKKTKKYYKHKENTLPFPHADSEIYYSKIYVALKEGVFSEKCGVTHGKSKKLWDAPVYAVSASNSYTSLALSAGGDGLFEMQVKRNQKNLDDPSLVSNNHCSSCSWSDYNINATSNIYGSFFAAYSKERDEKNKRKFSRKLEKVIPASDIFHTSGFSWGSHDKMYMYENGSIKTIKYSANKDGSPSFEDIGNLSLQGWKGDVISASVAPFGTIIEFENTIVIIRSDGEITTLHGEPVNWRVFSNTKLYKNQLHVIYDDRLEIHSFYHDYFINQNVKKAGIRMKHNKG
jgi:hypothetical protein